MFWHFHGAAIVGPLHCHGGSRALPWQAASRAPSELSKIRPLFSVWGRLQPIPKEVKSDVVIFPKGRNAGETISLLVYCLVACICFLHIVLNTDAATILSLVAVLLDLDGRHSLMLDFILDYAVHDDCCCLRNHEDFKTSVY